MLFSFAFLADLPEGQTKVPVSVSVVRLNGENLEQAQKLSRMFADNFRQYAGRVSREIEEAGPAA